MQRGGGAIVYFTTTPAGFGTQGPGQGKWVGVCLPSSSACHNAYGGLQGSSYFYNVLAAN